MFIKDRKTTTIVLSFIVLFLSGALCFSQITTPEAFLGYKPGEDFHLATYEQLISYFELIAGETNRIQIFDMGPTSMGRKMKYAIISSEENMAELNEFKEINAKLSLVRGVSKEQAEQLAEQGKVVVWIDVGLHATESSPAQHAIQLAYDIVTGDDLMKAVSREVR